MDTVLRVPYIIFFHILICGYRTLSTVYYFLRRQGRPVTLYRCIILSYWYRIWIPYFEYRIWSHIFSTETIIRFQFDFLLVENSPTPPRRPTRLGAKTNVCRWNGRVFESPFRQTILSERRIEKRSWWSDVDNLWIEKIHWQSVDWKDPLHMFKKMVNDEIVA